ncbi:DUF2291 domain-containing protein [Allorhizobium sp. BGMRC 0089]|nr:DUF2291 domain-containing protein [Allorhizobium sonneratiae]MCM2293262.1 DUF2291 domain-containing protein [Allorhizobium sonneratiae]
MAFDTKVVKIGSADDFRAKVFSPQTYGAEAFPKIKADVEARAVDAVKLAQAITADKQAATKTYGVPAGIGAVFPVKFTGTVTERKANYNVVKIDGMDPAITVRVQTGPALNGTDLRDATGKITFGQFVNQIQYQDAGSAINNEVKKDVLATLKPDELTGKTVSVVGAFTLINPKNWQVTPVSIEVK